jgi:diguanylate cyclase
VWKPPLHAASAFAPSSPPHSGTVTRSSGALQILSDRRDAFTVEDLTTLELLSAVVSSALSHAAEFEAKREQLAALTRFRTIFDGASIGITRTNVDGRNVEVNPAMERMLGYSAAELGELRFGECFHPDDVDLLVAPFKELMAGKRESFRVEARCRRKTGEFIWHGITVLLERDAAGNPAYTAVEVHQQHRDGPSLAVGREGRLLDSVTEEGAVG